MTYPGKGRADYLVLGDWNVVCYQCGRKRKASGMKKHWQGYWVCPEHWEPRQVQDFVRALPDRQTPPWVQPMPADVFAPLHYTLYPQEQYSLDEIANVALQRPVADTITATESFTIKRDLSSSETISFTETLAFDFSKSLTETITVSEVTDQQNGNTPAESMTLSENSSIGYILAFPRVGQADVFGNIVNSSALNASYAIPDTLEEFVSITELVSLKLNDMIWLTDVVPITESTHTVIL